LGSAVDAINKSLSDEQKEYTKLYAPTPKQIETLIKISFWASLSKEEGRYHNFSLAFAPFEEADDPFVFSAPLSFSSEQISKLAPALKSPDRIIGVWTNESDELSIWGFTSWSGMALTIRTFEPGRLCTKYPIVVVTRHAEFVLS
jgi:hypothetical protein